MVCRLFTSRLLSKLCEVNKTTKKILTEKLDIIPIRENVVRLCLLAIPVPMRKCVWVMPVANIGYLQ